MYNRYIPSGTGYTRVTVEEGESRRERRSSEVQTAQGQNETRRTVPGHAPHPLHSVHFPGMEDKNAGIAGILKALKLDELDSGDILLLLIILFLFLEGDNLELVITLGLMLLLGLGEDKGSDAQNE